MLTKAAAATAAVLKPFCRWHLTGITCVQRVRIDVKIRGGLSHSITESERVADSDERLIDGNVTRLHSVLMETSHHLLFYSLQTLTQLEPESHE